MSASPPTIALAQIAPVVGDIAGNLEKIRKAREDAPPGTDLLVFPELVITGYSPEDLLYSASFLDHSAAALDQLIADSATPGPALVIPAPERRDGALFNALHLIADGRVHATRYKNHLPNYGVFDEQRYFAPGPLPDPIPFRGTLLGLMICEDMWHADVAEHLKDRGADCLLVANASPFARGKQALRLDHARRRVAETGLPLAYVNLTGGQDDVVFDGASFALDATGELTLQTPAFTEGLYTLDGGEAPDMDELALIWQALTRATRDYVRNNGFSKVLLGLSGGIDSALVAVIAADALGPDAVRCVMLPSPFTAETSLTDAKAVAGALGCAYEIIPIAKAMAAFESTLPGLSGLAHENMQSRSRGLILMSLSNQSGAMLLTTGNKSEIATGYATLYGDMCGGFNPLKDVYKTLVYSLARWRNGQGPAPVIPDSILTRAPTAELRPNQTDQDSLPPYDVLDSILEGLLEQNQSVAELIAEGHAPETVRKVRRLLDLSEYKRRQSAPGPKITHRAFGRERRVPITQRFTQ